MIPTATDMERHRAALADALLRRADWLRAHVPGLEDLPPGVERIVEELWRRDVLTLAQRQAIEWILAGWSESSEWTRWREQDRLDERLRIATEAVERLAWHRLRTELTRRAGAAGLERGARPAA